MMKHPNIVRSLATASALALGVGLSGSVHAGAYALSYLNVDEAFVFFVDANTGAPADVSVDPSTVLSAAEARLNGVGVLTGGIGFDDAPPANAPPSAVTRVNNVFNAFGPIATDYSNADAWISAQQSLGDAFSATTSIAEGNTAGGGSGDADSQNTSTTGFEINFVIDQDAVMVLSFSADMLMRVLLHDDAEVPPSVAFAEVTASASITDSNGNVIFTWAPDGDCVGGAGTCVGITGGTELQDDLNLNNDITTVSAGDDNSVGGGVPGAFLAPNDFAAFSDILPAGEYTLAFASETDIGFLGEKEVQVPEPATLALMGMGLLGMGITRRRRKA